MKYRNLVSASVEDIEVIRRPLGGSVSIPCRHFPQGQMHMTLSIGLKKEFKILHMISHKITIAKEFSGRLRVEGNFPNVDVIISNLTSEDAGLYFCDYQWYDDASSEQKRVDDDSPVLLVVTGEHTSPHDIIMSRNRSKASEMIAQSNAVSILNHLVGYLYVL